ncbi:MAG TPA: 3,4-dihydroxy-2-butanone-4-phosphate synthase, partial [Gammaproteobacteria bacterium]|nr:3,4-dihydroxy-2-butanone-4-phosphate synthase [Gammaproteobacteria bacterium]
MEQNSTLEIIEELRQGRMVVIMDDEDRENEGDLVMAAELVTPAAVSRYAAALGNGGTVNNLMIVDSITSPEGDILRQRTPTVFNQFENAEEYLSLI